MPLPPDQVVVNHPLEGRESVAVMVWPNRPTFFGSFLDVSLHQGSESGNQCNGDILSARNFGPDDFSLADKRHTSIVHSPLRITPAFAEYYLEVGFGQEVMMALRNMDETMGPENRRLLLTRVSLTLAEKMS